MLRSILPFLILSSVCSAQTLEQQLISESPAALAKTAQDSGDARRGAILFHQVHIGCVKCHAVDGSSNSLGPDLTKLGQQKDATDQYVVTALLKPSADIRKQYQAATVVTTDGLTVTGLLVSRTNDAVTLRDPAKNGERTLIPAADIDEVIPSKLSIMPAGIVNQLGGKQQFLDLLRYVLELRDGGPDVARKLQPPPGLITFRLPEYEKRVDHAGLIRALDDDASERGEKIYSRLCINCHGDKQKPGSLPTALRFAEGKFRHGGDPYTMYKTLTHGFGLMVPQAWMVPKQKYDVIHYIRENYVRENRQQQYVAVTDAYLDGLPEGNTFGPEPVEYAPWSDMNYGPSMINTFEVGSDGNNFAYKGIAVRLDSGPGGVSKGNKWAIFDHDTMRLAAAWTRRADSKESGFINWQGIHFDGRHGTHPRIAGDLQFENPTGPGWALPGTRSFEDNKRVVGRDGRRYGPLPASWAKYKGLHTIGNRTIIEYTVGGRGILEQPGHVGLAAEDDAPVDVFTRTITMHPGNTAGLMLVATHPEDQVLFEQTDGGTAILRPDSTVSRATVASEFNGASWLQITDAQTMDMTGHDFSITARIRTTGNGTIFCKTESEGPWVPNGKTFFIRGGRLCYDIGWVGVVQSKKRIDDGRWHDVAMTWNHETGRVTFYIDQRKNGGGVLRPKKTVTGHVAKIGFSAGNFPNPSFFTGEIHSVSFWQKELSVKDIAALRQDSSTDHAEPHAGWHLADDAVKDGHLVSSGSRHIKAEVIPGADPVGRKTIVSGIVGDVRNKATFSSDRNRLLLNFPPDDSSQNAVVWTASVDAKISHEELSKLAERIEDRLQTDDLQKRISVGGPARWPDVITTTPVTGPDNGPFAIDALTTPAANPWFARVRLTGHDFYDDGDRVAVCSWDGDVWMVSGLTTLNSSANDNGSKKTPQLKWKRIASGLFQPLGLKIVAGDIYVTCRDQLVILRDRNSDGETDFYECFNSDHQVTEHFHEFAMGLQRDEVGNFYYAKSARHALKAVVPHHGTLLRIPSDGSRTDILANGFRAANGVCLNPDGSFIVTDQEGHWNPKNRINWVREGGFYGNMFGYHDVTDESNEAMEQPLCWITNAFDRSPAELMWIDNEAWGPLNGTLLNLSYGYGKVYVVPHEEVDGQMQGGMCQLPIPQFPTGTARGRISPHDNGLYLSGMFAWGSSQQAQEGGFYRIRSTGRPSYLPVRLRTADKQLQLTFTDPVDARTAVDPKSYTIKVWSLKRTANYGSKHYDEHEIQVSSATVSSDSKTMTLTVPELAPTWCMEIKCRLKSPDGDSFERIIHNTIHHLN